MTLALLKQTLSVQTVTENDRLMKMFIMGHVARIGGCTITQTFGNIYITKGEADPVFPCFVAHLDTVHEIVPPMQFSVEEDKGHLYAWNPVIGRYEGVGGDDKVGIYIALECLRVLPNCKVVFFRDEEIGCAGSRRADLTFFDDCAFVLQADRKGGTDFISRANGDRLHDEDFATSISPLLANYEFADCKDGGLSDVVQLRRKGLAIASANVSCGYVNPHTAEEYVVIADVQRTLDLFLDTARWLGFERWSFPVPPPMTDQEKLEVRRWSAVSDPQWAAAKIRRMRLNVDELKALNEATRSGVCPVCAAESVVWSMTRGDYVCLPCDEFVSVLVEGQSHVVEAPAASLPAS